MKGSWIPLKQKAVQNRDELMSQNIIPDHGKERFKKKKTIDHYFLPSITPRVTKKNHNSVM